MSKDEGIRAVREVREKISAEFDNDPEKLVAHYIERQKRHANRLLEPAAAQDLSGLQLSRGEIVRSRGGGAPA